MVFCAILSHYLTTLIVHYCTTVAYWRKIYRKIYSVYNAQRTPIKIVWISYEYFFKCDDFDNSLRSISLSCPQAPVESKVWDVLSSCQTCGSIFLSQTEYFLISFVHPARKGNSFRDVAYYFKWYMYQAVIDIFVFFVVEATNFHILFKRSRTTNNFGL